MTPERLELTSLSATLARVEVRSAALAFGVQRRGDCEWRVGLEQAPRYRIIVDWGEEALSIEPLEGGGSLEAEPGEDQGWRHAARQWLAGAPQRAATLRALHALPVGTYLLVRSTREVLRPARVVLGNTRVETPPHLLALAESDEGLLGRIPPAVRYNARGQRVSSAAVPELSAPHYVLLCGPGSPPTPECPLLGVVLLEYGMVAPAIGALFFDFCSAKETQAEVGAEKDPPERLLILPERGELVIGERPAATDAFRTSGAVELAAQL